MQNSNQKAIELLNSLVEINNGRFQGYEEASRQISGATMKTLFSRLADNSRTCRQELKAEIKKMDGQPKEEISVPGNISSAWINIKAALTNKDRKSILDSCELGEDLTLKGYEDALDKAENSAIEQLALVKKQYAMMKADQDKIKNLRSAFVKV